MPHRDELPLPELPRETRGDAVAALDAALAQASRGLDVLHAFDPRRILRFADGGPPVWSVGVVRVSATPPEYLYVTYGLSRAIDPSSPFEHELSIRVASHEPGLDEPVLWPTLFLRHLARYVLETRRPLLAGQSMTFADPITRTGIDSGDGAHSARIQAVRRRHNAGPGPPTRRRRRSRHRHAPRVRPVARRAEAGGALVG
jgi:hypothetical protein